MKCFSFRLGFTNIITNVTVTAFSALTLLVWWHLPVRIKYNIT